MAKVSSIEKAKRTYKNAMRLQAKRDAWKKVAFNPESDPAEREKAMAQLAKTSASSMVRVRNRCELTGRPRGNYRRLNLCRTKIRELFSRGELPGYTKSSW